MAVAFAERRFGLEVLDVDETLDDELRFRRHQQIDRLGLDHADRRTVFGTPPELTLRRETPDSYVSRLFAFTGGTHIQS